jgi:hypothetical protein
LLGEALTRTIIGTEESKGAESSVTGRHWNKKVSFVRHLEGAMRSIAYQWLCAFHEEVYLESEVVTSTSEGDEYSPLDDAAAVNAPPDQHLIAAQEQDRVFEILRDDEEATTVVRAWVEGLRQKEIISKYGFVAKTYAATVRRIRLKLLNGRK